MKIAVFCASANEVRQDYFEAARQLGEQIGKRNWQLVYGGTNVGLMQEVASATMQNGGRVTGIIPACIRKRGITAENLDELIIAPDMKERKHLLREHAGAFVALPGGWGTLEEITEVVTLKQLGQHTKPIVFVNTGGFYDLFFHFIRQIRGEGFISSAYDGLYYIAKDPADAVAYIENYRPPRIKQKY